MNARRLLPSALLLLSASCTTPDAASLIGGAEEVEVTLVELQMTSAFNGNEVPRAPPRTLGMEDASAMQQVMAALFAAPAGDGKKCAGPFNPDLRVTFKKGRHTAGAVFCFSCKEVFISGPKDPKGDGKLVAFDAQAGAVKALIDKVFADLPEERRVVGRRPVVTHEVY